MTDLEQLIGRLEAASEGSRPLDWLIAEELGDEAFRLKAAAWPPFAPGSKIDKGIPAYTTSIDAIVALIERKLPGWSWGVQSYHGDKDGPLGMLIYSNGVDYAEASGSRPTPALALSLALCRALQAQQETSDAD